MAGCIFACELPFCVVTIILFTSRTMIQHFHSNMSTLSRRPNWTMSTSQSTVRSAAATLLVLVLLLMNSPQISGQDNSDFDSYPASPDTFPPPPPAVLAPPAPPPPPVRTPAGAQNATVAPPPTVLTSPGLLGPAAPLAPASEETWADKYPATDFREASVPPRFLLWPENLTYVKFVYFCQQELRPRRYLSDFKYKDGEGRLQPRPYYDLGLVDRHNTPYFRRWRIDWRVDTHRIVCPVVCEYTDIQRLYNYRYRVRTSKFHQYNTLLIRCHKKIILDPHVGSAHFFLGCPFSPASVYFHSICCRINASFSHMGI
jgi:hypothetical protein